MGGGGFPNFFAKPGMTSPDGTKEPVMRQEQPMQLVPGTVPAQPAATQPTGAPSDINYAMGASQDMTPAQAVQNPFQSFRMSATRAAGKIAGLNLGEDMIASIFQGKSPQEFFNTIVAPFMLSSQLNQNRDGLISQFLSNPAWQKQATTDGAIKSLQTQVMA